MMMKYINSLLFFCLLVIVLTNGCAIVHRTSNTSAIYEWYDYKGNVVARALIKDGEKGGGTEMFVAGELTNLSATHINQSLLGGSSIFGVGSAQVKIDTNTANVITAGGTAVGKIVEGAVEGAK